jgi:hypothetical protein
LRVPAVGVGTYRLVMKVNGVPSNTAMVDVSGIASKTSTALKRD